MALCAALLVLCIVLAAGRSKATKTNAAALPEVRNSGTAIQWKYSNETDWRDLVALTELRGAAGEAGKDGNTPFIGENGNWWIGEIDTGVKAAGIDGTDGVDGEKGDKGDKGDAGQNGGSSGYLYGTGYVPSTHLSDGAVPLYYREMHNRGGLTLCGETTIRLKKGHTYNVCVRLG